MKWNITVEIEADSLEEMVEKHRELMRGNRTVPAPPVSTSKEMADAFAFSRPVNVLPFDWPRCTLPEAAWEIAKTFEGWFRMEQWRAKIVQAYPYHKEKAYRNGINQAAAYMVKTGKIERRGSHSEAEFKVAVQNPEGKKLVARWPKGAGKKSGTPGTRPSDDNEAGAPATQPDLSVAPKAEKSKKRADEPSALPSEKNVTQPFAPPGTFTPLKGDSRFKQLMREAIKQMPVNVNFTRVELETVMKQINSAIVNTAPMGSFGSTISELREMEDAVTLVRRDPQTGPVYKREMNKGTFNRG